MPPIQMKPLTENEEVSIDLGKAGQQDKASGASGNNQECEKRSYSI